MRVLVTTESRFDRTPDGAHWVAGWAHYQFWRRYLDVFDGVCVLARVRDVLEVPDGGVRADGPNVSFSPLPYYIGPWVYLRKYPWLRAAARRAIRPDDALILRAPGPASGLVEQILGKSGRPFGIEVLGDVGETFAPGGVRSVLRPFLRHVAPWTLRRQCARACAAAYVTSHVLPELYPAPNATHVTSYSSIDLPDAAFVTESRSPRAFTQRPRLVCVGSLEQMYKSPDVLLDALVLATRQGARLELTWIGDGKHRREMEARAAQSCLDGSVRFVGHLPPGEMIRKELDRADLFVLVSRTEGLPRALIEAMARGLPCVGSNAGGIAALLSPAERVPIGAAAPLADKLLEVLNDPDRLTRLSQENLVKARAYHTATLRPRRRNFYETVRVATLRWQTETTGSQAVTRER